MKTKEKNEFVRITTLGIATALIGSMVGPGFSSGNELMQFFGKFRIYWSCRRSCL